MDEVVALNLCARYENRMLNNSQRVLPVVVITGYLGSGKTTLLRHLLARKENLRLMIGVNDFAKINVDGMLMRDNNDHGGGDGVIELSSGSFVCSLANEFESTVWRLLQDESLIDYLVLECSGVTNPSMAIVSLEKRFGKMTRARLDNVVCVVDTEAIFHALTNDRDVDSVVVEQLLCADVVVLNKLDLVEAHMVARVTQYVQSIVPHVVLLPTKFCDVGIHKLLALDVATDTSGTLSHEGVSKFYVPSADHSHRVSVGIGNKTNALEFSSYDQYMAQHNYVPLEFECDQPLSLAAFTRFIVCDFPQEVVRGKGFLWFEDDRGARYTIQLTSRCRLHLEREPRWITQPKSTLIFVVRASLDTNVFLSRLRSLVYEPQSSPTSSTIMRDFITAHELFEMITPAVERSGNSLYFRVTPALKYQMNAEHLACHGVVLNEVNDLMIRNLNYAGGVFFAFTTMNIVAPQSNCIDDEHHHHHHFQRQNDRDLTVDQLVLMWSPNNNDDRNDVANMLIPKMIAKAEETVTEVMKHVMFCACGR